MICPNCSHENEGGKFCENCGAPLNAGNGVTVPETGTQTASTQASKYLESTKKISKMYFSYFMQVLKQPYASSRSVGEEHFVNGLITVIIYSLLIPLMIYFGLRGILSDFNSFSSGLFGEQVVINPPFTDVVLKPAFAYLIFIALVIVFTFAAIKLGHVHVSFKEVFSRFGSFLIPTVGVLLVALVMSILKIKMFLAVMFFGFIGSVFLVPPLVIASFKKESTQGVDVIYGALITYALTFIAIGIMGDMLFDALKNAFSNVFGMFGGF